MPSAQAAFPDAKTFICPGVERKRPEMRYDRLLDDTAPETWAGTLDQVLVSGHSFIREVVFFHRATGTLILVDLVEYFTDATPHANWQLRLWWKLVFRTWNRPTIAPEYRFGWRDRAAARAALRRILAWDFRRVILAHGDLIEADARAVVAKTWEGLLA